MARPSDAEAPLITLELSVPPNAQSGRWVRIHEVDLPEAYNRLPIGDTVRVRDIHGTGDHLALVDQVDRDSLGRRYWLLIIAPRVALSEARRTLDVLCDFVVASGVTLVITRRGKPIARMVKWPPVAVGGTPSQPSVGPLG